MSVLGDRLLAVHDSFVRADVPHAFGGAVALAYCTYEPRGTRDIDVNVFATSDQASRCMAALPEGVVVTDADVAAARRDDQVRVWWHDTPIDLFFDAHEFHHHVARGVRDVPFEGRSIPVLDCVSLAVFKSMYGRTRDWADIEAMVDAGSLDVDDACAQLDILLGADDPASRRFRLFRAGR